MFRLLSLKNIDEPGESLAMPKSMTSRRNEDWEDWMQWDDFPDEPELLPSCDQVSNTTQQGSSKSKKRKSLSDNEQETDKSKDIKKPKPLTEPRSHNIVERRYRTNINQKIAALRDSIPRLRDAKELEHQPLPVGDSPVQKLNKATVLSTAVDYIHELEKDKRRLENEISQLRASLRTAHRSVGEVEVPDSSLHLKANGGSPDGSQMSGCTSTGSSTWSNPAKGMIEVPEDMRRLRNASMQARAGTSYVGDDDVSPESRIKLCISDDGAKRAKFVGKLMVGSFAGLMVMQGFGDSEADGNVIRKRSLLAVPTSNLWRSIQEMWVQHGLDVTPARSQVLFAVCKIFIFLFILGFGVFLYAFCSKPKPRSQPPKLDSAPSLTSPVEVRRNAWLTAIQTVRVPRHEMFPEWAAVNLEALQYVLRHIIGWHGYSKLTGQSDEDEVARVRAWDIAIDAQLMGGDTEISGSRLILTILASGTLPVTPARLVLKAMHLRIMLWKSPRPGKGSVWAIVHKIAAALANHQWRIAQKLQRKAVLDEHQDPHDVESLPEHLAALLQLNCSEVLTDPIIQRAHNLAWSRPIGEDVYGTDRGMDLVAEDSTIRSPHDALCAWVSGTTLQRCLFAKLSNFKDEFLALEWDFGVALHTAPPASIVQARALAANAVFVEANHQNALSVLLQDFMPKEEQESSSSTSCRHESTTFVDSSLPKAVCYDVSLAIYCALALDALKKAREEPQDWKQALHTVSLGYQDAKELTWLSFASAVSLLRTIRSNEWYQTIDKQGISCVSSRLWSWFQESKSSEFAIDQQVKTDIEDELRKHLAISSKLDTVSPAGVQRNPERDHEAPTPLQGLPSVDAAKAPIQSRTSPSSISPSSLHQEPEMKSAIRKDRRASHCSEDSGYGSVET